MKLPPKARNAAANRPRTSVVRTHFDRNVYLMLMYTLGKGLQLSIAAISINLYAYSLGYRSDFIGLLAGMPSLGGVIAGVPIGMLADRWGRKPLLLFSAFFTPLTLLAIAFSTTAVPLLVASLLNGLLASAYWVTNLPMLTESTTGEERVRALALNSFLLLGLGALGSSIGGVVPEIVGYFLHLPPRSVEPMRAAVIAAGVVAALPAFPLLWLREPRRTDALAIDYKRAEDSNAESPAPSQPLSQAQPDRLPAAAAPDPPRPTTKSTRQHGLVALFVRLLVPDVLFTLGESSVVGLLQIYFVLRFGLQPGTLGIILTVAGVCGGATALMAPRIVRRFGKLRIVIAMPLLSIPVVLTIGFAPFLGLAIVAEFVRNILRGIFDPSYTTFTMEQAPPSHRATLTGFYGVTWGAGYSVGAALAGVLQAHVSLSAPFAVGAVCLAGAATMLYVFFGRASRGKLTEREA